MNIILPTYLNPYNAEGWPVFTGQHVVKPVYGHGGISITIHDNSGVVEQSRENAYGNQMMVYQEYAPLPTTTIQTEDGLTEVNLVYNCFIVGETASAIGVRASRKLIIDDFSYFLPICFR
jgi:glutathionylspermidine synthase